MKRLHPNNGYDTKVVSRLGSRLLVRIEKQSPCDLCGNPTGLNLYNPLDTTYRPLCKRCFDRIARAIEYARRDKRESRRIFLAFLGAVGVLVVALVYLLFFQ